MDWAGRHCLVTGAARGIGRAIASALLARGARVTLADRDLDVARQTAEELGAPGCALRLDVTDAARWRVALEEAEAARGPLWLLVHNAGVMLLGPLEEQQPAADALMLAVNLHGPIAGTRAALPGLRARGAGHIVFVASLVAASPLPGGAVYCATKAGLVSFGRALGHELHGSGVEVHCVLPSATRTRLLTGAGESWMAPVLTPERVAQAVVRAVERNRGLVPLPGWLGWVGPLGWLLPERWRRWLLDRLSVSAVFAGADPEQRRAYRQQALADPEAPQNHG